MRSVTVADTANMSCRLEASRSACVANVVGGGVLHVLPWARGVEVQKRGALIVEGELLRESGLSFE